MLWIAKLIFSNMCFVLDSRHKRITLVAMMVYNGQVILDFGDIVFFYLKVHLKEVRSFSNLNLP